MSPTAFGLQLPDSIGDDWEQHAHLVIADLREDGAIDFSLVQESGGTRYLATAGAKGDPLVIEAPTDLDIVANDTREVIERNQPIVRRPSSSGARRWVSIIPVMGKQSRVVIILEPMTPSPGNAHVRDR